MPFDSMSTLVRGAGYEIDASSGAAFDEISTLASAVCRTAQSAVMLKDSPHGWRRVSGASRLHGPPVAPSFCDYVLEMDELLIVEDTAADWRFSAEPDGLPERQIRFLAGVPFSSPSGLIQGVLCVSDRIPRALASDQEEALVLLGRQLNSRLELHEQRQRLEQVHLERETSATNLRASEELFRTFMNASPFLSYIKDAAGRLLFYNRSYAKHFGISEYAWLGRTDEQLWSRAMTASIRPQDHVVMSGGRTVEAEEKLRTSDGGITVWKTYRFPCFDSSGNLLLAGLAMDVTEEQERKQELERSQDELQAVNEQLRRLSMTDELTGLRNRRAFEERLVLEFSMSRRRKRDLAVLLIDVDDFKTINDRWGHDAGDTVLRRLGAILRTTIRLPDLVARYGGEEFVVLLPESGVDAANGFSRRLMKRIEGETWDHAPVTVSIGLAALHDSLLNGFQLVSLADEALYAAKRAGKNRVVISGDPAL